MNAYKTLLVLFALLLASCSAPTAPAATSTPPGEISPPTPTPAAPTTTPTYTPLPTETPVPTSTITLTPVPTNTSTATVVPTYVKLRGEVTVDQAVCHYGPGAPYLYKYGVYKGSHLEIIGRIQQGTYIEVQAIGGDNPCWVNPQWMKIDGDLMNVRPIRVEDVKLPQSPYYAPLTGVSARRDGDSVTVFWNPLVLRAGDDSEQVPYLIEAWVCQGHQIVFTPLGSYQTALKINDEAGCSTPSHGRIFAAEKHGYTRPVEIPWPTVGETAPADITPTP